MPRIESSSPSRHRRRWTAPPPSWRSCCWPARNFDDLTQLAELASHLRRAPTTRGVIDQAIGIVIGARRCTPAQEILRSVSQTRNIRLHAVAEELVARTATGAGSDL